VAQPHPRRWC